MNNKELLEKLDNDVIEALKQLTEATTDLEVGNALSQLVYLYNFNPINLELMNTTIDFYEGLIVDDENNVDYPNFPSNIDEKTLLNDEEMIATTTRYYNNFCNDDLNESVSEVLSDCELKNVEW